MSDYKNGGVIILDFGSQYTQLIARKIRELNVFSRILSHDSTLDDIMMYQPNAIILSGGPSSVYELNAPVYDNELLNVDIPILGICYGLHILAHHSGGSVKSTGQGEYGFAKISITEKTDFLQSDLNGSQVWMSHMDQVTKVPDSWSEIAKSSNGIVAAMASSDLKRLATQFHPEVSHTEYGKAILENFLFKISSCHANWTPGNFIEQQVNLIREEVGNSNVLIGVSGGVDSSVVAAILNKAIGGNAMAVLIDHGLLRKNEASDCVHALKNGLGINIHLEDESDIFFEKLSGITDPEQKRKIIGNQFIHSFEAVSSRFDNMDYLAQGTLYPDVIESGIGHGKAAHMIKSHHNVGGLPENMKFKLIEPLRELFKDEVRKVGKELGLPEKLIKRHPFPGPGLGVRVIGEITPERVAILQEADNIYIDTLEKEGLYDEIWQAFAILIPVQTVGVMGDQRTYENLLGLRAVTSTDGMTADWYRMSPEVLSKISNNIVNSVKGINRVTYDVTSKPPGTIEWE